MTTLGAQQLKQVGLRKDVPFVPIVERRIFPKRAR
jgi:hypothetical protein